MTDAPTDDPGLPPPLRVWIPGAPVPQPRPRVVGRILPVGPPCRVCRRRDGKVATSAVSLRRDSPIADWRVRVGKDLAEAAMPRWLAPNTAIWLRDEPVSVALEFWMPRPKDHYRKVGGVMLEEVRERFRAASHLRRPDVDNLAKAVLDELPGSVTETDEQVVELRVTKLYAPTPRQAGCLVTVRPFILDLFPAWTPPLASS